MKVPLPLRLVFGLLCWLPSLAQAWQPGTYPEAPARMFSSGFTVDNQSRNDVLSFWHAVYQASEGYSTRMNWTGDYSGNNGTTSLEFVADVERRLNYFRAMCGVPADATVNTGSMVRIDDSDAYKPATSTLKSTAAQSAALMLIRNYNASTGTDPALSHNAPSNVIGWSAAAWNANAHGNFAFGTCGPDAITQYCMERLPANIATSSWNSLVGHRRWCLFPGSTDFATGDQPGTSAYKPPTNNLYVLQKLAELIEPQEQVFVAYPAPGFFPVNLNSPFWSVSRKGANFNSATVKMTDHNGASLPVTTVQKNNSYGDPAIIWSVGNAAGVSALASDTTFNVRISGIAGVGIPTSFNYSVTLVNPDQLTSNQQLVGPASIASNGSGNYTFTRPEGAEAMQIGMSIQNSTVWKEDAESTTVARVLDGTDGSYPLIATPSTYAGFGSVVGTKAFHLTFPTSYDLITRGVPQQSFVLDRDIIAKANAKLNFRFRRGYMTTTSTLNVEVSADGGVTWSVLGAPIIGRSNTNYDLTVTSVSSALTASTTPLRIRFRYFTNGGAIFTNEAAPMLPTGIFLDEITTRNCDWLEPKKLKDLSATATKFVFKQQSAGSTLVPGVKWQLRLRTQLGGRWFAWGPPKAVLITAP